MSTAKKARLNQDRKAIALPLFGLSVLWLAMVLGTYTDLFVSDPWSGANGGYDPALESVHASTYLIFAGIAALGICSVLAKSKAERAGSTKLAHAARGFTVVAVVVSLIIGVIFGFGTFGNAMNNAPSGTSHSEMVRVFGVYVPILLDAALLVFVILKAFVGHKEEAEDE